MREADPAETLTDALTVTRRSFQSNATTAVRLAIAFSLCNIGYHVVYTWLLVEQVGVWAWALCIPNGIFYAIMAMVIMMAIWSISSMDDRSVTVQAEHVRLVFNKILEMETTFWEQSETITRHIAQLERLVSRLEQNPTRNAFDATLEATVKRGAAVATGLRQVASPKGRAELVRRLEDKLRWLSRHSEDFDDGGVVAREVESMVDEVQKWASQRDEGEEGDDANEGDEDVERTADETCSSPER